MLIAFPRNVEAMMLFFFLKKRYTITCEIISFTRHTVSSICSKLDGHFVLVQMLA